MSEDIDGERDGRVARGWFLCLRDGVFGAAAIDRPSNSSSASDTQKKGSPKDIPSFLPTRKALDFPLV